MRGHYFKVEYVKHLPFVAGAMIDSHTTAEYWKNRTRERLRYASEIITTKHFNSFLLTLALLILEQNCNTLML